MNKIPIFKQYLNKHKLLEIERIIGHQSNFLNDTIFQIKWKGFKQGFDEWRVNYYLIDNEIHSQYCHQHNIVKYYLCFINQRWDKLYHNLCRLTAK